MLILKQSKIHGVGVFTTKKIDKGIDIEKEFNIPDDSVLRKKVTKPLEKRYCCKYKDGYYCPENFNRMSLWWYLNHSKNPNIDVETRYNPYMTNRIIKANEELTINYEYLNDDDYNKPDKRTMRNN